MAQLLTSQGGTELTVEELKAEHANLETRLDELGRQRWLSPEEQYEKAVIKKRKLAIKDRIQQLG